MFVRPALLRGHFQLARALLAPSREAELARRVDRLTETRHDAVDASAAELRRIERDLHDGAQARLVAMGMDLGAVEALIEKDPAQARRLVATARDASAEALTELRDLVRGIHPPVLAERGLRRRGPGAGAAAAGADRGVGGPAARRARRGAGGVGGVLRGQRAADQRRQARGGRPTLGRCVVRKSGALRVLGRRQRRGRREGRGGRVA